MIDSANSSFRHRFFVAPLICVSSIISVVSGCSGAVGRDAESYELGQRQAQQRLTQEMKSYSPEYACKAILGLFLDLDMYKHIDRDDAMAGCLDQLKKS